MYILIADSGSTKTDWVLLNGEVPLVQLQSTGLNPYFQAAEEIEKEIRQNVLPSLEPFKVNIREIHYYGTGCSTPDNCRIIENALRSVLEVKLINVSHDLLAAARSLCNKEWGIASILGTGSNSCLYNGVDIIENVPSTGYLWSDYGGGSQIGKHLIREYFEDRMPGDLRNEFEKEGFNREVILNNVYKKGVPGKYLASVSHFASKHSQHPFILHILEECFDSFFNQQVKKYSSSGNYKVHTVGSVGFYYKDIITRVAKKHGYTMGNMIKSPMEGLIRYHTNS